MLILNLFVSATLLWASDYNQHTHNNTENVFDQFVGEYQLIQHQYYCKEGRKNPLRDRGAIKMRNMDSRKCPTSIVISWKDDQLILEERNFKGKKIVSYVLEEVPTRIRSISTGRWLSYSKHYTRPDFALQIFHDDFTEYRRERDFLNWKEERRISLKQDGSLFYYENLYDYVNWKIAPDRTREHKKLTLDKKLN